MENREYSRRLNELQKQIFHAILSYDVYMALWPTEKAVHTLNLYGGLFIPVRNALYQSMFMGFSRVLDRSKGTISLINLLRATKTHHPKFTPNLTIIEIEEMINQILRHNGVLTKIKNLRDQQLAHLDAKLKSSSPPTIGEINSLIETLDQVFNKLSYGHDKSKYSWSFQQNRSKEDTAKVLHTLKEERAKRIAERAV